MVVKHFFLLICVCFLVACTYNRNPEDSEDCERKIRTAKINTQLGIAYLERHNIQRAKQKLLQALTQAPTIPETWYSMGYFLESTGEKTQAQKYYLKAIKLAPGRGDSQNNYGTFLCRAGDYYGAIQHFLLAARDPNYLESAGAYENAGLCSLRIPNEKLAARYFKLALAQDSNRPISLFKMADIYYRQGNFKNAKIKMDQFLAISPATQQSLALNENIQRRLGPKKTDNYLLGEKFIQPETVKNVLALETKEKSIELRHPNKTLITQEKTKTNITKVVLAASPKKITKTFNAHQVEKPVIVAQVKTSITKAKSALHNRSLSAKSRDLDHPILAKKATPKMAAAQLNNKVPSDSKKLVDQKKRKFSVASLEPKQPKLQQKTQRVMIAQNKILTTKSLSIQSAKTAKTSSKKIRGLHALEKHKKDMQKPLTSAVAQNQLKKDLVHPKALT